MVALVLKDYRSVITVAAIFFIILSDFSPPGAHADFVVANTSAVETKAAAAYNPTSGEVFVAFLEGSIVRVKRFKDGVQQGGIISPIGELASYTNPAIACGGNQCMVAFGFHNPMGQPYDIVVTVFLDQYGNVISGPGLFVGIGYFSAYGIRVVYNSILNQFLVVSSIGGKTYGQHVNSGGGIDAPKEIPSSGQLLAHAPIPTTPVGGRYFIGDDQTTPKYSPGGLYDSALNHIAAVNPGNWGYPGGHLLNDIVYGEVQGMKRFLLVYSANNCAPGHTSCDNDLDIQWYGVWGTFIDPDNPSGADYNTPFPISKIHRHTTSGVKWNPRVAYNPTSQSFFVAWHEVPTDDPMNDFKLSHIRGNVVDYFVPDGVGWNSSIPTPYNNFVVSPNVTGSCQYINGQPACVSDQDPDYPAICKGTGSSATVVWQEHWPSNPPDLDIKGNSFTKASLPLPDLVVTALSNPPASINAGGSFTVTDTTKNQGVGQFLFGSQTRYYLSADTAKSSNDILLGQGRSTGYLAPGASSSGSATATVPSAAAAGSYYLLACADDYKEEFESNETNNCKVSATTIKIQTQAPDLIETAVSNPPSTAKVGGSFSVTDTAKNQGNITATASTTKYYLSLDTVKGSADILLTGGRSVPSLAAGASSTGTVTVTISSLATGSYYLLACADGTNVVAESNEANNCKASAYKIAIQAPDLIETAVSNPPSTAKVGGSFSVTDTAKNQGNATAAASTTKYYLSLDTVKGSADKLLTGGRSVPSLAAGASSSGTVTVTIPSLAIGSYYLLACADGTSVVPEGNETNNCKASAYKVAIQAPDLIETAVSNPPSTAKVGGSFSVTDTAKNQGNITAAASTTKYYLSLDTVKGSADILLTGGRSVPSLAAGASSSGTVTVTIPSLAIGSYYLLACADGTNVVPEGNETNNCKASAYKVAIQAADLIESLVSNPPASVYRGGSFSVTDTVKNQGNISSGSSTTRYYLSTDTVKSSGDILLSGSRSVIGLAAGASNTGFKTVTVPSTMTIGYYYVIACSDDLKVVPESNETNNCKSSGTKVQVK